LEAISYANIGRVSTEDFSLLPSDENEPFGNLFARSFFNALLLTASRKRAGYWLLGWRPLTDYDSGLW
jgi:hypothetical protein